jgi:hypothetical protein
MALMDVSACDVESLKVRAPHKKRSGKRAK